MRKIVDGYLWIDQSLSRPEKQLVLVLRDPDGFESEMAQDLDDVSYQGWLDEGIPVKQG